MKASILLVSSFFLLPSFATGVREAHTVRLDFGWNAFFLTVQPSETPSELFSDWPVEKVGMYDQAAYLRTEQFDSSSSTLGAIENPMKYWVRDDAGITSLDALLANAVYICFCTNVTGFTTTVYGEPEAMRTSWHSSVDSTVNYVGLSTDGTDAEVRTVGGYFLGLDVGATDFRKIYGSDSAQPGLKQVTVKEPKVANGKGLAIDSIKTSDWSGPLFVSPMNGIDMGTNHNQGVVTVRNDAGTNRIVRIAFKKSESAGANPDMTLPDVHYFDSARQSAWVSPLHTAPYECELAAGETLTLKLAVDRTTFADGAGTEFGGILEVTDVSTVAPTHFQTAIPLSITAGDSAERAQDWPNGLWVATISLDAVPQFVAEGSVTEYTDEITTNTYSRCTSTNEQGKAIYEDVEVISTNKIPVYTTAAKAAGSVMKARIFVHRDVDGNLKMLQRARLNGRRYSTAMLPTDLGVVDGTGTFGTAAVFAFTVAEHSRVNPMYHAKHPDHDGLDSDFKEWAKEGSEVFEIGNRITLKWDANDAASWNPEETMSGTASWAFTGLRREGELKAEGKFTIQRLSSASLEEIVDGD